MKQIIQNIKNGETELIEVPTPHNKKGHILVQTKSTVLSVGTERMLLDFGKANLINKALQQPEKVKQVINKVKTDGVFPTLNAVKNKFDLPIPLGYCNAGVVLESTVDGFSKGDRVASNGPHAEVISVPKNLCAKIPDNVSYASASFTVLGSIALQGIRLMNPSIGDVVVVKGLGVVGLLTVQILMANGCQVIAVDFEDSRCSLAKKYGADVVNLSKTDNLDSMSKFLSNGNGVDGVIITAASKSNQIIHRAAEISRKRGKIILVGVVGLNMRREDFYKKELTFQVSCSYGPGRYDPNYEEKGLDYPHAYVRWTEKRNFETILQLISNKKIKTKNLISHEFDITNCLNAYELISKKDPHLGIVLNYKNNFNPDTKLDFPSSVNLLSEKPKIAIIGAGNYAGSILIPSLKKANVVFKSICSNNGLDSTILAKKYGFANSTTDIKSIIQDEEIDLIIVTTRHDSHAELVVKSLKARKHIFIEKPLALKLGDVKNIKKLLTDNNDSLLCIGYNRRFAPLSKKIRSILGDNPNPLSMVMTVNAGHISKDHWIQDKEIGGGRIIGEVCHFIDLLRFFSGSPIKNFFKTSMSHTDDVVTIQLIFENGSMGTIHYFSNGDRSLSKERLEIYFDGKVLQLDNFKVLRGYGVKGFKKKKLIRQDKGQTNCMHAFIKSIQTGQPPIPYEQIIEVSEVTIKLAK